MAPAKSQKPGQARPFNWLELAFGPAQIFRKPGLGTQAVAFSYQEWHFEIPIHMVWRCLLVTLFTS